MISDISDRKQNILESKETRKNIVCKIVHFACQEENLNLLFNVIVQFPFQVYQKPISCNEQDVKSEK